jgi:long-chain acyl-CoA synthetase
MIDKVKRYQKARAALDECETLKGKKIHFDSMAEMIMTRAQEIPDKIQVLYYDEVITYAQTNERSNRVANYLKAKGVKKGDICSVMVLNSPEVYYSMFGIQKLGAIAGAVNYMLKGPEIAYVLDDSKPKVAFVSSGFMAEFARGYEIAKHKPIVVEVEQGVEHGTSLPETTMKAILEQYPADEAFVPQALDDATQLIYSSGTTGYPKGILQSNRNILSICQDGARFGAVKDGAIYDDDMVMIIGPMFHGAPLNIYTYPYIYLGITICIRKMFSPDDFWPSLARYGVTGVWGVPAMYQYVLYNIDPKTIEKDKIRLRYAFSGGAPIPVELIKDFYDRFGTIVADGYGLTEATNVSVSSFGAPFKPGSVGHAYYSQEVEIMDENNNILPYGERGEICIKGEAVMLGYLNKPEATAEVIRDGWLHTGDIGSMDEEGYLYFHGRLKEMINRGGENIYPREIEIPLEEHPAILEVAVVGAPDEALGERVKACIVLKESGSLTEQDIIDYLKPRIAKYKLPEIIQFYDTFPKNPTGKILKNELK